MNRFLLIIIATAIGALALYKLERVVVVLILAMLFAYLLAPVVESAERPLRRVRIPPRLSRGLAIGLVYVVIAGVAWAGAAILLPTVTEQINEVASQAPGYAQSLRTWEGGWVKAYQRLRLPIEVRGRLDQGLADAGDRIVEGVRESLVACVGMLSYLPWLVLIPVLAFFLLKDAGRFRQSALETLPERFRWRGYQLFEELNTTLAAYIRAQLLACLLVGTVCGIGFAAFGLPYAVLLGVLAGVAEFIPFIGPLVIIVVAGIVGALHAPALPLYSTGFLLVLRVIEDYVVYPRLMGDGMHLHPLAVIVAVLAGFELGGLAGIFLAVPVVAALSVASRHGLGWLNPPPSR